MSQLFRISGLVSACDYVQRRIVALAKSTSAETQEQLSEYLHKLVAQVDALCADHGNPLASLANLPTPSRRAYQWLRFLLEDGALSDHLSTVALAYEVIRGNTLFQEQAKLGFTMQFELNHSGHLWRIHTARKVTYFTVAEGFCGAPREVFEAIVLAATTGSLNAKDVVRAYASGDTFSEIATGLELFTEQEEGAAQGRHYDLDTVFARVNHELFGNAMPRPRRLIWSSRITSRIMGYYHARSDTVMLSRTLDDAHVPEQVVNLVMYHELLHKHMGARQHNGRRQVHFDEFRQAERRFPRFEAVHAMLEAIARQAAGS